MHTRVRSVFNYLIRAPDLVFIHVGGHVEFYGPQHWQDCSYLLHSTRECLETAIMSTGWSRLCHKSCSNLSYQTVSIVWFSAAEWLWHCMIIIIELSVVSGIHLGFFVWGGRTPLFDHTYFVGTLYWHIICTTLGLMAWCAHTGRSKKQIALGGRMRVWGGGKISPCTRQRWNLGIIAESQ